MIKKIAQEKVDKRLFDFDTFYKHLNKFIEVNGRFPFVRETAIDDENYKLGKKVQNIKQGDIKIDEEKVNKLNRINFPWSTIKIYSVEEVYELTKEFKDKFNRLPLRSERDVNNTCNLGEKLHVVKISQYRLTKDQIQKFTDLGFSFEKAVKEISSFDEFYDRILDFVIRNKRFPSKIEKDADGNYEIGSRFANYRHKRIKLTSEQIEKLNLIGFPFTPNTSFMFEEFYPRLVYFKKIKGRMPRKLDNWDGTDYLYKNLNYIRCGIIRLTSEQEEMLRELGFDSFGVALGILNENGYDV